MILIDTETTGLIAPEAAPLRAQPHLTEIFCAKLGDGGQIINTYHSLIKPPIPISEEITKITGITDETLQYAPAFKDIVEDLSNFFVGSRAMVAHNLAFDRGMLVNELRRLELEYRFPWPYRHICTAEASIPIEGRRLGLARLYELETGSPIKNHHRAEDDVKSLRICFLWLCKQGYIT